MRAAKLVLWCCNNNFCNVQYTSGLQCSKAEHSSLNVRESRASIYKRRCAWLYEGSSSPALDPSTTLTSTLAYDACNYSYFVLGTRSPHYTFGFSCYSPPHHCSFVTIFLFGQLRLPRRRRSPHAPCARGSLRSRSRRASGVPDCFAAAWAPDCLDPWFVGCHPVRVLRFFGRDVHPLHFTTFILSDGGRAGARPRCARLRSRWGGEADVVLRPR